MQFNRNKLSALAFHLFLVAALAVLVYGCGKKMPPIPPDSLVPGRREISRCSRMGRLCSYNGLFLK